MSESELDVRIGANALRAIRAIEAAEAELSALGLRRAVFVAWHNNYKPVRFILGRRLGRRLGVIDRDVRLYGVPVVVDESVEDGFGLVTRPPGA